MWDDITHIERYVFTDPDLQPAINRIKTQIQSVIGQLEPYTPDAPPKPKFRIWNKKHDAPIPAGAVYVGRPTKWGNPFSHIHDGMTTAKWITRNREESIQRYEEWLHEPKQDKLRADMRQELQGKELVCWCAPQDCHARIIMDVANAGIVHHGAGVVTVKLRRKKRKR